ncbi:MAG: YIP1 family protein [Candidatus Acidiferrales bacterium]
MASFVDRVIGAATLKVAIYEDIEADKGATVQALAIVVLSSLAVGFAQAVGWFFIGGIFSSIVALVGYTILAVAGWFVWTLVTFIVGTKILPEPETSSNMGELVRTVGFAQVPGMLRVVTIIPILGWLIGLVVWVWMLAAFVIAARQALDYKSTIRAVVVCAIGWVINGVIVEIIGRSIIFFLAALVGAPTEATGG